MFSNWWIEWVLNIINKTSCVFLVNSPIKYQISDWCFLFAIYLMS